MKWLFQKAGSGTLQNFTSIDSPYERPIASDIPINVSRLLPEQAVEGIVEQVVDIWSPNL